MSSQSRVLSIRISHYCSQMLLPSSFIFLLWILVGCGSTIGYATIQRSITVDQRGNGDFKTVQEAIDSVPDWNNDWIRIHVNQGVYSEKVKVSALKEYILLEGDGARLTKIQWGDHARIDRTQPNDGMIAPDDTMQSATFTVFASNFKARGIEFTNTYNLGNGDPLIQAVAALIGGDKASFYDCSFIGNQDTLCDYIGRHYFHNCFIEGAVDFIFGFGQSIYEHCTISIFTNDGHGAGYITAQGRACPENPSGFVFKYSTIMGSGKAYLGRAYGPYSTVVIYKTYMSDVVVPEGWDAWDNVRNERLLTYAENSCTGPGSDLAHRVKWEKRLSEQELDKYVSIKFIDREAWLFQQP